jgi:carbon-monoxide dehydrogenase medium subunit
MEYIAPNSLQEITKLLKRLKGKGKLIAGGTNVIPDLRADKLHPQVLIDLSHLKDMSYIKEDKRRIRIGGLTPIAELASSKIIRKVAPVLAEAADELGNPLVRNRATVAGNLAHASPAADTAVPLLALEATVVVARDGMSRQIPIEQFFRGPNRTVLKAGEIIKEISFEKSVSNTRMSYSKLGRRSAMAISVASVSVLLEMENGKCKKARIGLGAVAPKPVRAYGVEKMLEGKEVTEKLIEACCEDVQKEINPITDIRASAEYRRQMGSVLLRRLLREVTQSQSA